MHSLNTSEQNAEDAADDSTIATLNTLGNHTLTTFSSTAYTNTTPLPLPSCHPNDTRESDIMVHGPALSQKAKQTSVVRLKHQHGLVALLNLLKSSDFHSTGLLYKTASSSIHSNVTEEQRIILEVFEVYDARQKVDTVWFTLLKVCGLTFQCLCCMLLVTM